MSILLALAADAWWAGRQDRLREQQYLSSLHADFLATDADFRTVLANIDEMAEHGRVLLRLLDNPVGSVPVDSLEGMVRKVFVGHWFTPILATYQDMVNSGTLGLIQSDSLRGAMVGFEASLETLNLLTGIAIDHWTNEISPFMTEHFDLTEVSGSDAEVELTNLTIPGTDLGPPSERLRSDPEAFWSREFTNLVARKMNADADLRRWGATSLQQLSSVLELIEESQQR